MIVIKIILAICIIVQSLWTLWGIVIHFNLIESDQPYDTPFPLIRIIFLSVFICIFITIY